jgi:hypothetical protein
MQVHVYMTDKKFESSIYISSATGFSRYFYETDILCRPLKIRLFIIIYLINSINGIKWNQQKLWPHTLVKQPRVMQYLSN